MFKIFRSLALAVSSFFQNLFREIRQVSYEEKASFPTQAPHKSPHNRHPKDIFGNQGESLAQRYLQRAPWNSFPESSLESAAENSSLPRKMPFFAFTNLFSRKRYDILEKNYVSFLCEIDFIVWDRKDKALVFIEVKTRHSDRFGQPFEAVNLKRQKRMANAAAQYIRLKKKEDVSIRFDVISILWDPKRPKIAHFVKAFDPLYEKMQ